MTYPCPNIEAMRDIDIISQILTAPGRLHFPYPATGRDASAREHSFWGRVCVLESWKGKRDDGPNAADGGGAQAPHRVGQRMSAAARG
jgi:hypothetical protein